MALEDCIYSSKLEDSLYNTLIEANSNVQCLDPQSLYYVNEKRGLHLAYSASDLICLEIAKKSLFSEFASEITMTPALVDKIKAAGANKRSVSLGSSPLLSFISSTQRQFLLSQATITYYANTSMYQVYLFRRCFHNSQGWRANNECRNIF